MDGAPDPSDGQLWRLYSALQGHFNDRFNELQTRLEHRIDGLGAKIDRLDAPPRPEFNQVVGDLTRRISDLEQARKDTFRSFVVAFLFPMVSGLVVAIIAGVVLLNANPSP